MTAFLKKFFALSLFMLFLGSQAIAQSGEAEVRQLMQNRDKQIKTLMGPKGTKHTPEQTEKLKTIINEVVDFEAMGKTALQDTWTEATDAQKKEFVTLFSSIIRDQSLAKPDMYRAAVTYDNIEVNGASATVKTTAVFENVRTPVSYTMSKASGKWMITDIVIDNVSTAASYQKSFQNVIRKKGFASLLESLRKRADRA